MFPWYTQIIRNGNRFPQYDNPKFYRENVGSLIYLASCIRPDLAFNISLLKEARGFLRYLKYSVNYNVVYTKSNDPLHIIVFTDSDLAHSTDSHRISG